MFDITLLRRPMAIAALALGLILAFPATSSEFWPVSYDGTQPHDTCVDRGWDTYDACFWQSDKPERDCQLDAMRVYNQCMSQAFIDEYGFDIIWL